MKRILQITMFLFSAGLFACTCDPPSITEKYIESDFVARATIVKNYKNESTQELYKADIIINELFKGERLKSIYVRGRSDGKMLSSCGIFIPENTELLIYAHKNKDGSYSIGMCSGLRYITNKYIENQNRELNILKTFKAKNIDFTDKITYREKGGNLHENLKEFKGINLEREYGIYEITFATDLRIKKVEEICGFGNSIDEKLIEIISKTEWLSFDEDLKNKVPDNSKLLIGIYYYRKGKDYPSFLSQFYL